MPTQFQLEGPELEPLLARVRAEHGSSAKIVQAEKVRTGGVGGFFSKQHFEITVEVDDALPPAPAPAPAAAQRPTSILDLVDEVSAAERTTAVSTESTGFAAVLARLGAAAGAPDSAPAAVIPQQRAPLSPQSPRRTTPRPTADVPCAAATPAPRRRRTDAPVRAAAPGRAVAVRPTASTGVRTVAAPGAGVARPTPGKAVAVRPRGTVAVRPAAAPATRTAVARTAGALATAGRKAATREQDGADLQLAQLGLPDHLRPLAVAADLHPALVKSLRALPKPPRLTARAGSVVAVVGPLAAARELAGQMAEELGLPRTAVVSSAGAGGLRTAAQARTRRAAWSKRRHATIVVIDTPLTAAGALHARALLDALAPVSTWGVVEATRKPRDVGAWTRAVGRVDALALTCVDETADPAAVLELGIPVGRLGARKATPALWATLLTDRVAA